MSIIQPRATPYRSAGLSQPNASQYTGNAFVYLLASRIDPNLCKIGKGNPTTRCDHWNSNSPHGGIMQNNLYVFAAYGFDTETDALGCESQAHALYNFVNLNPNAAGGEQEFFAVPPQQAKAALDLLHGQYTGQQAQASMLARLEAAEQSQREAAVQAQQAIEQAQREAAEQAQREATEQRIAINNLTLDCAFNMPYLTNLHEIVINRTVSMTKRLNPAEHRAALRDLERLCGAQNARERINAEVKRLRDFDKEVRRFEQRGQENPEILATPSWCAG